PIDHRRISCYPYIRFEQCLRLVVRVGFWRFIMRPASPLLALLPFLASAQLCTIPLAAQQQRAGPPPAVPPQAGHTIHRDPGEQSSRNVKLMAHIPLGGFTRVGDIEVEQELSRPYAYVSRTNVDPGFDIINLKDPSRAQLLYHWGVVNPELHV